MTWFSKKHLDDAAKIAELTTTNKIHKFENTGYRKKTQTRKLVKTKRKKEK